MFPEKIMNRRIIETRTQAHDLTERYSYMSANSRVW
ncbi:hypothetical protein TNCV_3839921, partial [Trichonephila clavipes]